MLEPYINKFMQSRQASGPAWFETRDYIFWRPISHEGRIVILGFAGIIAWIVLSDISAGSILSPIIAFFALLLPLYGLFFLKGKKV
jgi:hypothetical protein